MAKKWRNLDTDKMSPEQWKKNLRMSKEDFLTLVDMIKPCAKSRSAKIRQDVLNLKKRAAITLHYLENQGSMQMTGIAFGIAHCTVGQICYILSKNIGPELITFLFKRKRKYPKQQPSFYQRFGFPQVIGCADGTHVPIISNHQKMSMIIILTSDFIQSTGKQFVMPSDNSIMLKVKWPGSLHDARVFANCGIQKRFAEGRLKIFYKELRVR